MSDHLTETQQWQQQQSAQMAANVAATGLDLPAEMEGVQPPAPGVPVRVPGQQQLPEQILPGNDSGSNSLIMVISVTIPYIYTHDF